MSSHNGATIDRSCSTTPKKTRRNYKDLLLPTMIVFDLDDCLWSPEMHELPGPPCEAVQGDLGYEGFKGTVGMKVRPHGPTVRLFPGARQVLLELATNPELNGIILAVASSSLEPSYSHLCLDGIEILPGLTLRKMMQYDAIGRNGKLSPSKQTHFKVLHEESQVPYVEMLFFDDCNWGDNCEEVNRAYGVVGQRTPTGLDFQNFQEGLKRYHNKRQTNEIHK